MQKGVVLAGKASGALLPAYLAVGSNSVKAGRVVERLRARLDDGLAAFNLDERESVAVIEPGELLASLNTLPVGPGQRLVIIHGADKLAKPCSEAIVGYLQNPNPGCVLCLVAEALARTTRLYKAVAAVGRDAVIDCGGKKAWQLPAEVRRLAQRRGMSIDESAARELVDRVGESIALIDGQLKTLSELCRASGSITRADVVEHVARTAEVKPWDFLDAVCDRDAGRALSVYALMPANSEVRLVSLLAARLRELVCARSLMRRGTIAGLGGELLAYDSIAATPAVRRKGSKRPAKPRAKQDWQLKNHQRWAGSFGDGELERALVLCGGADAALKGGADPRSCVSSLILDVCGAAPSRHGSLPC